MRSRSMRGALVGVVLAFALGCSSDRDSPTTMPSQTPADASPTEATLTQTPAAATTATKVTRCADVRLPDGGVGEADFGVRAAEGLLDIHFSDMRRGKYRNIAYTVRYLDDPSCRSRPELAELIGRVGPPGWPPVVLGARGAGPLRLGMTHQALARIDAASTTLGSRHDGWPAGCRILNYRTQRLGRVPGGVISGTVSPEQGLEQLYATRRMVTPQGIRIGSPIRAVRDAYKLRDVIPGDLVTVPASAGAVYRIGLSEVVTSMSLELRRLDCLR